MPTRVREGVLFRDVHKRYCIQEMDAPTTSLVYTCTSGCPLEIWLNRQWVTGIVEGDGEDYWLFVAPNSKFLLAEQMRARHVDPLS